MKTVIIRRVVQKSRVGDVTRRCVGCDSSFHLELVNAEAAKCNKCGHINTPIGDESYFVTGLRLKVKG